MNTTLQTSFWRLLKFVQYAILDVAYNCGTVLTNLAELLIGMLDQKVLYNFTLTSFYGTV